MDFQQIEASSVGEPDRADASLRLAVFESEGVSTDLICAYFDCEEETLERLREDGDV